MQNYKGRFEQQIEDKKMKGSMMITKNYHIIGDNEK